MEPITTTTLNWPVLIWAGVIDSINPCAIGVLVFLLAYLVKSGKKWWPLFFHGSVYLFAVFITYLLAGMFLLPIIQQLKWFSVNAYLALAAIIGIFWFFELKEFLKPSESGSIVEIAPKYSRMIKNMSEKITDSFFVTFGLWAFVALVELPCTGAVYLAVLTLMAESGLALKNIQMLILYNLLFIAPLFIILVLFCRGTESHTIDRYVQKYKPYMRLLTALLLIWMAAWMVIFTLY